MAGTTRKARVTGLRETDVRALLEEFNKLVTDVELLRANYATGTGVTATAAAALTAAQIANFRGVVVTTTAG